MYYSLGQFPAEDGIIAPGMSCRYPIRFTPDSLANFHDELTVSLKSLHYTHVTQHTYVCIFSCQVLLHNGDRFSVSLRGCRPTPDITCTYVGSSHPVCVQFNITYHSHM